DLPFSSGYSDDVIRWSASPPRDELGSKLFDYAILNDADQDQNYSLDDNKENLKFGAMHSVGANFVYADGSVHTLPYEVEKEVCRALGERNSGQTSGQGIKSSPF